MAGESGSGHPCRDRTDVPEAEAGRLPVPHPRVVLGSGSLTALAAPQPQDIESGALAQRWESWCVPRREDRKCPRGDGLELRSAHRASSRL